MRLKGALGLGNPNSEKPEVPRLFLYPRRSFSFGETFASSLKEGNAVVSQDILDSVVCIIILLLLLYYVLSQSRDLTRY